VFSLKETFQKYTKRPNKRFKKEKEKENTTPKNKTLNINQKCTAEVKLGEKLRYGSETGVKKTGTTRSP
jgi:hypothetical protein